MHFSSAGWKPAALLRRFPIGLILAFSPWNSPCAAPDPASPLVPGLVVSFRTVEGAAAAAPDVAVLPQVQLYVPSGRPPTPFIAAGRFVAEWEGFISSELRDTYTFQAKLNGELKLAINGEFALDATGSGSATAESRRVRLNKGTNAFSLTFTSPRDGDAWIRLAWSSPEFPMEPIRPEVFAHSITPDLNAADRRHRGRELFLEYRCARCHTPAGSTGDVPELSMDAPSFEEIGSRRNAAWMSRWLQDPKALRRTARMPRLFNGAGADADAAAAAAYLASLTSGRGARPASAEAAGTQPGTIGGSRDGGPSGDVLFEILHCAACHDVPGSNESDPDKISLRGARAKFSGDGLREFLMKPEAHYAWTRMPNFKLTADESARISTFVNGHADPPPIESPAAADPPTVARGRSLVQTAGCLSCHSLPIENRFRATPLLDLPPGKWNQGCLADEPGPESKAPRFAFSAEDREALRAFGATDRRSLNRHVPAEFAERQSRLLNCRGCHGRFDGFPGFDLLGDKLRPEWSQAFIGGTLAYNPRPWLEARMPAFASRAEALATGLAMQRGRPPRTPEEPPIDEEAAKIGRKLVSGNRGFFCISCHGIGKVAATQVFEAPGINLARSAGRLQHDYFHRWVLNPLRVDSASRMPVYFDHEAKSSLPDYYGGDGHQQIEAIWQYIRLGDNAPSPLDPPG
jgi:mono/diheme cytochrome c family protein